MTKKAYVLKILELFGIVDCSLVPTLMIKKLRFVIDMQQLLIDLTKYCSIVGCLIQLYNTRFHINFVVGIVSRFMA